MKIKRSDLENLSQAELAAIANKLQQIEQANKTRSLQRYLETAHEDQKDFHKAPERIRFFLGGNRSGKTTGGVVEDLWLLLGTHPFKKNRVPLKGLLVIQDFENHGKNIIEPKFQEWAPSGAIVKADRNQNGAWRKVYFDGGSVLDILSHDQDLKVFEGGDWDFAHFDEPPPKKIFTAVWRGLTDRGGTAHFTMTPIAEPWMYSYVKKALEGDDPMMWARYVDITKNAKNLGDGDLKVGLERIEQFVSMLDPEERESRKTGAFLQMQGLIFKSWQRKVHLIPKFVWPVNWEIIESIDPHPSKPWGISWTGITGNKKKILLRSGLFSGDIYEIADQILYERSQIEIERDAKPKLSRCLIDNSSSVPLWQRSNTDPTARRLSVREELENLIGPLVGGRRIEVAPKNVKSKIDLFKKLLHVFEEDGHQESDFYVFDIPDNERFVFEIENYVWDVKRGGAMSGFKDAPRKIDDDILDSVMQVVLTLPRETSGEEPESIKIPIGNSYRVG